MLVDNGHMAGLHSCHTKFCNDDWPAAKSQPRITKNASAYWTAIDRARSEIRQNPPFVAVLLLPRLDIDMVSRFNIASIVALRGAPVTRKERPPCPEAQPICALKAILPVKA